VSDYGESGLAYCLLIRSFQPILWHRVRLHDQFRSNQSGQQCDVAAEATETAASEPNPTGPPIHLPAAWTTATASSHSRTSSFDGREGTRHLAAVRPPVGEPVSGREPAGSAGSIVTAQNLAVRTSAEREDRVLAAREELRAGPVRIAAVTGVPARTVSRILLRHRIRRLAWFDPLT
jgi:hypothetical protein